MMFACQIPRVTMTPTATIISTLTATATKVPATRTPLPTFTPRPTLTPVPSESDCFSIETLAYLESYATLSGEYDKVYKETVKDLEDKDISLIEKDMVAFAKLIDQASILKTTPLVAEFHRYLLAELTTYHKGLELLAQGNKKEAVLELRNGDGLARNRLHIGKQLNELCYPDLRNPNTKLT